MTGDSPASKINRAINNRFLDSINMVEPWICIEGSSLPYSVSNVVPVLLAQSLTNTLSFGTIRPLETLYPSS